MLIITLDQLKSKKGNTIIYRLMQDQSRRMNVMGIRGLYYDELEEAEQTTADYLEMKPSFVWDDGEQTEEQLSGTCALEVTNDYDFVFSFEKLLEIIEDARIYGDRDAVGILISETYENGEDNNEIIMEDARLVCVIKY